MIKAQGLAVLCFEAHGFVAESDLHIVAQKRAERRGRKLAVPPREVHREPAARAQARDGTVRPRLGQCGEEFDDSNAGSKFIGFLVFRSQIPPHPSPLPEGEGESSAVGW